MSESKTHAHDQQEYRPSIIVTGSSTFGLKIFGPKTVAKFWTLILFTPEYDWTSSRNLENRKISSFHCSIVIAV